MLRSYSKALSISKSRIGGVLTLRNHQGVGGVCGAHTANGNGCQGSAHCHSESVPTVTSQTSSDAAAFASSSASALGAEHATADVEEWLLPLGLDLPAPGLDA